MARTTRSLTAQLVRHGELLPLVAIAVVAMVMACADEIAAPAPPVMMVAARRAPPATSRVLAAYEALRAESVFAAPRVGYAGQLSPQSRHFHVLLADRHASDLFGR